MVATKIIQWFLQGFGAFPRCNERFLDGLGGVRRMTPLILICAKILGALSLQPYNKRPKRGA